jgi:integrase
MKLTDTKIKNAKATGKEYRLADGHGLCLHVTEAGARLWRWRYRFEGREKVMSFGAYPIISLSAAREAHDRGRRTLANGVDPMAEKKAVAEAHNPSKIVNPFREVEALWFEKWKVNKDERYVANTERRIETDILPRIGDRPINDIRPPEIVDLILAIEERGAADVARRALQQIDQIFRYGMTKGHNTHNPAGAFKPKDILKQMRRENFKRVSASELPVLLRKIHFYAGSPITRLALKLIAYVFLRTSELIEGRWRELNLKEARWDIPKERMKGGRRPHIVPLSRQAIAIFQELWNYRKNAIWMFPGERTNDFMSNNTILGALDRMGYKGKMTGHGFRGVASTILHEKGYESEHIEIQLAHGPQDEVEGAYNWAKYLEQRRLMMQDWADYLDQVLAEALSVPMDGPPAPNITTLSATSHANGSPLPRSKRSCLST